MKTKKKKSERKREVLPIFKTNGSLSRSILTTTKDKGGKGLATEGPVSIVSIVEEYKLDNVAICDDTFLDFPSIYKNLSKICHVVYGLNFYCCNDTEDKSAESVKTECKISVFMKNSSGYRDLIRIHNKIHANEKYFYYHPRLDWETITDMWTENLVMMIPPYDNFIHNNLLKDGLSVPQLGDIKPIVSYGDMELPFDYLLTDALKSYADNNNLELIEAHPIYYYKEEDLRAYMISRCVDNRTLMSNPNLDFMTSNKFSFESYLNKVQNG